MGGSASSAKGDETALKNLRSALDETTKYMAMESNSLVFFVLQRRIEEACLVAGKVTPAMKNVADAELAKILRRMSPTDYADVMKPLVYDAEHGTSGLYGADAERLVFGNLLEMLGKLQLEETGFLAGRVNRTIREDLLILRQRLGARGDLERFGKAHPDAMQALDNMVGGLQRAHEKKLVGFIVSQTSKGDEQALMKEMAVRMMGIGVSLDRFIKIAENPSRLKMLSAAWPQCSGSVINADDAVGKIDDILLNFSKGKQAKIAELAVALFQVSPMPLELLGGKIGLQQKKEFARGKWSPIDDTCVLDKCGWDAGFAKQIVRMAGKNAARVLPLLGVIYENREDPSFMALLQSFKGEEHYVAALYGCKGVQGQKTIKGKTAEIMKRMSVLKEYGVESVERFDSVLLEHFYSVAMGKADKCDSEGRERKLALIVLNKNDWNGGFADDQSKYHDLIEHGYNLIFCEAGKDTEVAERFFNYGKLAGKPSSKRVEGMKAKYDLLVLGGHGTPSTMTFGKYPFDQWAVDASDYSKLRDYGNWDGMLTKRAAVLLWSCETAGAREHSWDQFTNLINMFSGLTRHKTFAPTIPTSVKKIEFDSDDYVVGQKYGDSGASASSDMMAPRQPGAEQKK
ncbi:MAG: hypothetical protein WC861_07225 [Candidatus Micrarchaeia archaeon]